jgi:hypothetical protein
MEAGLLMWVEPGRGGQPEGSAFAALGARRGMPSAAVEA